MARGLIELDTDADPPMRLVQPTTGPGSSASNSPLGVATGDGTSGNLDLTGVFDDTVFSHYELVYHSNSSSDGDSLYLSMRDDTNTWLTSSDWYCNWSYGQVGASSGLSYGANSSLIAGACDKDQTGTPPNVWSPGSSGRFMLYPHPGHTTGAAYAGHYTAEGHLYFKKSDATYWRNAVHLLSKHQGDSATGVRLSWGAGNHDATAWMRLYGIKLPA